MTEFKNHKPCRCKSPFQFRVFAVEADGSVTINKPHLFIRGIDENGTKVLPVSLNAPFLPIERMLDDSSLTNTAGLASLLEIEEMRPANKYQINEINIQPQPITLYPTLLAQPTGNSIQVALKTILGDTYNFTGTKQITVSKIVTQSPGIHIEPFTAGLYGEYVPGTIDTYWRFADLYNFQEGIAAVWLVDGKEIRYVFETGHLNEQFISQASVAAWNLAYPERLAYYNPDTYAMQVRTVEAPAAHYEFAPLPHISQVDANFVNGVATVPVQWKNLEDLIYIFSTPGTVTHTPPVTQTTKIKFVGVLYATYGTKNDL